MRPHRYALALATGEPLGTTLALHECDMPVCVKVAVPQAVRQRVADFAAAVETIAWR